MAMAVALILIVAATLLALGWRQRCAPWFLGAGLGFLGSLRVMARLGIAWPDLGMWSLVLNPYLIVTLAFVLVIAGAVGVTVRLFRRFGWFGF